MPVIVTIAFAAGLLTACGAFLLLVTYNAVVTMRQRVDKAWANIEVVLQQRHDELPNVVDSVRGEMDFEQSVLKQIALLRAAYAPSAPVPEQAATSAATTQALKSFFAVVENYPSLRAADNVTALQAEIERLETLIADRRELYNDAVYRLNSTVQQLPVVWFAGIFGWQPRPFFDAEPAADIPPDVSLTAKDGQAVPPRR